MHRLVKLSTTPLQKYSRAYFFKFNENLDLRITEKTCLLCKELNNICGSNQIRTQSTNTNPNIIAKKLRKRKTPKKTFVELVMVSDKSLTQKKATIHKLTSSDLKLLASTNLNLSELYKLKEISTNPAVNQEHTYNNLTDNENIPSDVQNEILRPDHNKKEKVLICEVPSLIPPKLSLNEDEIVEPIQEIRESIITGLPLNEELAEAEEELEGLPIQSSLQPAIIKEHAEADTPKEEETTEVQPKNQIDYKYKDEITRKTLASYIEVFSHVKDPHRGLSALNYHRGKAKKCLIKYYPPIKNVRVYNVLLRGFALRGNYSKIQEVLKIMQEEHVELDLHSYVAIFECLGRINVKDNHFKDIQMYIREASSKGINFDQMMNEGVFLFHQRQFVMKCFRSYDASYTPKYKQPTLLYKNHLVDHLNNDGVHDPLSVVSKNNDGLFKPEMLRELVNKQLEMEKEGYVTVKSIESKEHISEEVHKYRKSLAEHYEMWQEQVMKGFRRDLASLISQKNVTNMEPYLRSIPPQDIVDIMVDEAKRIAQGSETYSPTTHMLYRDLGNKVYARYRILRKQNTGVIDKTLEIHNQYCTQFAALHPKLDVLPCEEVKFNSRQLWQKLEDSVIYKGATLNMDHQEWVPTTLQFIGKFLYHIIMHDIKIDVNSLKNNKGTNYQPAFYTVFRHQGRLVKEEVKPHPVLCKLYRNSVPETLTFPTYELPMICPPLPWISTDIGGYLVSPCDFIRLPSQATMQKQRLTEAGTQQLYPSLDALNQLASVPWKVNQKILDVILNVFNSGGSSSLDVPQPPSSLRPPPAPSQELDKAQRYQLFRQKLQYRRKKAEMYSLWCDCLYRLSLANHFRNDIFWLPHNMDFRGRVYPVPPHLNHLGSDLARSMLIFAEARPLGPSGLDWLKIHLINLTGLKKRDPVSERLKFANENMDLILDSADNPLTGRRWWTDSDEPWQTLACCMEIADVLRSPDPEKYRSHFPVHQDGSCNGLQHYAALGRDTSGAYSVNLTPSEVPQDVYSAVVTLVEEQRTKDAAAGIEIARILEGFVKRKVIKQTIMTTVYGVTRFGARLQIARQLKDIDKFPKEHVWAASSYLTGRTFESLRTMFTSTRAIQDWFTECARFISSVGCQQVEWVTPLGLPIVQPYSKFRKWSPNSQNFVMDKYEKPNVMKQKNAFPPNFIHSLDSSHMMLTSLNCERVGITFVSVHDCYWTHPSTVHIMNKICREQFVALHSEPILEELSEFLVERYTQREFANDGSVKDLTKKKLNRILKQLPQKGDFDINQVLNSVYFFS